MSTIEALRWLVTASAGVVLILGGLYVISRLFGETERPTSYLAGYWDGYRQESDRIEHREYARGLRDGRRDARTAHGVVAQPVRVDEEWRLVEVQE